MPAGAGRGDDPRKWLRSVTHRQRLREGFNGGSGMAALVFLGLLLMTQI